MGREARDPAQSACGVPACGAWRALLHQQPRLAGLHQPLLKPPFEALSMRCPYPVPPSCLSQEDWENLAAWPGGAPTTGAGEQVSTLLKTKLWRDGPCPAGSNPLAVREG